MILAEEVIILLEAQIARLAKLTGEEVGGFVMIVPPEGEAIAYMVLDSTATPLTFFDAVNKKMALYINDAQLGGVNVPGMPRGRGR